MMSGVRLVALFFGYSAIGFAGEYGAGLFAQEYSDPEAVDVDVEVDHDFDFDFDFDIDPDVRVNVHMDHGECSYQATRELSVSASAEDVLSIDAGSGELRVEGRYGLERVEAVGRVCASHEEFIDELLISAQEGPGGEISLSAHYPSTRDWRGDRTARIDLTVLVPLGMALDIDDSSGSMIVQGTGDLRIDDSSGGIEVSGANGSVFIDDSSGGIEVFDVAGDVEIRDGSGGIDVLDVQGTVQIDDGSGGIDVAEVDQHVIIEDDGSGSIHVRNIAGDFIVRDDGSGSVRYSDVGGTVDIPDDERRRKRRRPRG